MMGDVIRQELKKHNMTKAELARRIGVTGATITHYIYGEVMPKHEKIIQLARVFGVTTDYLYEIEKPFIISKSGLTEGQISILEQLAEQFQNKPMKHDVKMTNEQSEIVGRIVEEFLR